MHVWQQSMISHASFDLSIQLLLPIKNSLVNALQLMLS